MKGQNYTKGKNPVTQQFAIGLARDVQLLTCHGFFPTLGQTMNVFAYAGCVFATTTMESLRSLPPVD